MEASLTDAVTLERLDQHYRAMADAQSEWNMAHKQDGTMARMRCVGGCGKYLPGTTGPCPECLRLVAAACRDAAGRVEK